MPTSDTWITVGEFHQPEERGTFISQVLLVPGMLRALDTMLFMSYPESPHWPHFWTKSWYHKNALVILAFKNRVRLKMYVSSLEHSESPAVMDSCQEDGRRSKILRFVPHFKEFYCFHYKATSWVVSGIRDEDSYLCLISWCYSRWFHFQHTFLTVNFLFSSYSRSAP